MCFKVISPEEPKSNMALPALVLELAATPITHSENGQKRVRYQS